MEANSGGNSPAGPEKSVRFKEVSALESFFYKSLLEIRPRQSFLSDLRRYPLSGSSTVIRNVYFYYSFRVTNPKIYFC